MFVVDIGKWLKQLLDMSEVNILKYLDEYLHFPHAFGTKPLSGVIARMRVFCFHFGRLLNVANVSGNAGKYRMW